MIRHLILAAALTLAPLGANAGGDDSTTPPKTTNTSKKCLWGKVWDEQKKKCVKPNQSDYSQDQLIGAVRELAYAGQYESAQIILSAMEDQKDDRVLTYWGFTHRKLGDLDKANAFYSAALEKNPDNLLARSYMGQGFVAEGQYELAEAQLTEIRARGGTGTWAETSLATSIETRKTFNY